MSQSFREAAKIRIILIIVILSLNRPQTLTLQSFMCVQENSQNKSNVKDRINPKDKNNHKIKNDPKDKHLYKSKCLYASGPHLAVGPVHPQPGASLDTFSAFPPPPLLSYMRHTHPASPHSV